MVLISLQCIARSGGGGVDFSGGDSDMGAIIEIAYLIIFLVPFPYNIGALVILIIIAFLCRKKYKQSSNLNTLKMLTR